ncbi:MAG: hypothetical protein IJN94_08365 [Clostridia bacterium]|nr:hypothetical protein [Clostridia bacterium]
MNKRRVKIIVVAFVTVVLAAVLFAVGMAENVTDGMFNMNTPTKITKNSTVVGTINSKKDYEAFVFEIEKEGALSVRLDHDNMLDSVKCGYVVTLYKIIEGESREYKEITYFESFWSDVTSSWGETGVSPGTYCVVVDPGSDILYGDFTLVTTFTPSSTFEKELNDTKETANSLGVGYAFYGSSSQRSDGYDHDWYVFELSKDSCVNISFAHDDLTFPKAGWNIKLINENDEVVCDFTSKLTDTLLKTGKIGLKAGTYYIKVENVSTIATTYSIMLGSEKAVNNEFELNDTPETATELPQDVETGGSLADRLLSLDKDYYKINVPAEGVVDITFSHEELEGDKNGWNIRILKKLKNGTYYEIIKKVSAWNSSGYKLSNVGLEAGDYYILIDGDSLAYNSASYTLQWAFTQRSDFEVEPNGSRKTAKDIVANTYYYGAIISSDVDFDEDYYRFEITEKRNVSLELWHKKVTDSSVTWVGSIIDEDGNVVKSIESSLDQGLVLTGTVTLEPGTYYVKIETGMYESELPYYFKLVR